jgi:hypothetical protein
MKKTFLIIAWTFCILCGLIGAQINYGPDLSDVPGMGWLYGQNSKLDYAVVVYESKNQPIAEISVMGGQTANAIRKAGKWRQYDQNVIPADSKPILEPLLEKYGVPFYVLIRGDKPIASGKLPSTDADLYALIEKKGGF